jgi:hypothetical protein
MNTQVRLRSWTIPLFAVSLLALPLATADENASGSAEISRLFTDAKVEAVQLQTDAADMESFTRSDVAWETYASQVTMIREHVNAVGRLIAQLNEVENRCTPWQKTAIQRITPLLRELADNTEATITHLNDNHGRVHMPPFKEYVAANYELSRQLATLITDFVGYGNAKDKVERLEERLEVS